MFPFPQKEPSPDFSKPAQQDTFIQDTQDMKRLTQKELDVNQVEQNLLKQRIHLMKDFIGSLPSSDPQYGLFITQIEMDQLEMEELKSREIILKQKLSQ